MFAGWIAWVVCEFLTGPVGTRIWLYTLHAGELIGVRGHREAPARVSISQPLPHQGDQQNIKASAVLADERERALGASDENCSLSSHRSNVISFQRVRYDVVFLRVLTC